MMRQDMRERMHEDDKQRARDAVLDMLVTSPLPPFQMLWDELMRHPLVRFSYDSKHKYDNYWKSELRAEVLLNKMGYRDFEAFNGDADSFGPLTRTIQVTNPEGIKEEAFYG